MPTPRQEQLRPASFRGVAFHVDEAGLEAGRRTQVHDYPQRDKPFVEDLGRATRVITLTAFVVGDDYISQAEKLLGALETKGSGTLVHPWHGTLQATAGIGRVRYRKDGLGYAAFELTFTEAGELAFPSALPSTQAASRIAADDLVGAAEAEFAGAFSVLGVPDFVADGAVADVRSVVNLLTVQVPGLEALGYAEKLAGVAQDIVGAIASPPTLARLLSSALSLAGLSGTTARWASVVQSLTRLVDGSGLAHPAAPAVITSNRVKAWTNTAAINALARRTLLAQAVGATSLLQATVYDDVLVVRNAVTAALDAESLTAGDGVYSALQVARTATWSDLTARAQGAARLRTYTPPAPLPALAIAYELYGDASRDDEIAQRNQIRHPGFVPVVPLQVLMK